MTIELAFEKFCCGCMDPQHMVEILKSRLVDKFTLNNDYRADFWEKNCGRMDPQRKVEILKSQFNDRFTMYDDYRAGCWQILLGAHWPTS